RKEHYVGSLLQWHHLAYHSTASFEFFSLSLHDALPISEFVPTHSRPSGISLCLLRSRLRLASFANVGGAADEHVSFVLHGRVGRSEEHTSELQSRENLVCRLLLEKKKDTRL